MTSSGNSKTTLRRIHPRRKRRGSSSHGKESIIKVSLINDVTILGGGGQDLCDGSAKALVIKTWRYGEDSLVQNCVTWRHLWTEERGLGEGSKMGKKVAHFIWMSPDSKLHYNELGKCVQ